MLVVLSCLWSVLPRVFGSHFPGKVDARLSHLFVLAFFVFWSPSPVWPTPLWSSGSLLLHHFLPDLTQPSWCSLQTCSPSTPSTTRAPFPNIAPQNVYFLKRNFISAFSHSTVISVLLYQTPEAAIPWYQSQSITRPSHCLFKLHSLSTNYIWGTSLGTNKVWL